MMLQNAPLEELYEYTLVISTGVLHQYGWANEALALLEHAEVKLLKYIDDPDWATLLIEKLIVLGSAYAKQGQRQKYLDCLANVVRAYHHISDEWISRQGNNSYWVCEALLKHDAFDQAVAFAASIKPMYLDMVLKELTNYAADHGYEAHVVALIRGIWLENQTTECFWIILDALQPLLVSYPWLNQAMTEADQWWFQQNLRQN
ncbi:MAG: hypothetical protein LCH85_00510 [Chloroflexi bacterium]|nr:hypothetical protein [Chloroflexota bacterium]